MGKDVAVVIPFYNGSQYIERAIRSVLNQTKPPTEIIVVDDGSTSSESAKLAEICSKYKVRILTQENGGQGSARNLGVRHSKSDFICLLDQDDYFLDWHIEHLLKVTESDGDSRFAVAYGDLWRIDGQGRVIQHGVLDSSAHPKTDIVSQLRYDQVILPSASLISKSAFTEVGGFDSELKGYEDDDLFMRFFAAGFTSVYTPRAVTAWTVNEESTSFSNLMSQSRWLYFEKLRERYPDRPNSSQYFLRDCFYPRFSPWFAEDLLVSVFLGNPALAENRQRLKDFCSIVAASPSCSVYRQQLRILRWISSAPVGAVVFFGKIAASRLGNLFFPGKGRARIRPLLRELVLKRKYRYVTAR